MRVKTVFENVMWSRKITQDFYECFECGTLNGMRGSRAKKRMLPACAISKLSSTLGWFSLTSSKFSSDLASSTCGSHVDPMRQLNCDHAASRVRFRPSAWSYGWRGEVVYAKIKYNKQIEIASEINKLCEEIVGSEAKAKSELTDWQTSRLEKERM